MGTVIDEDGKMKRDVMSRIEQVRGMFASMNTFFTSRNLRLHLSILLELLPKIKESQTERERYELIRLITEGKVEK